MTVFKWIPEATITQALGYFSSDNAPLLLGKSALPSGHSVFFDSFFLLFQFILLLCFIEHLLHPTTVLGAKDTAVYNTDISIGPLATEVGSLRGQTNSHMFSVSATCSVCVYIFSESYKNI